MLDFALFIFIYLVNEYDIWNWKKIFDKRDTYGYRAISP